MKWLISLALLLCSTLPFVGYYNSIDDAEINTRYFIKRYPTLQMEFVNLFANDSDHKSVDELSAEERGLIIDYCRYRFGINTRLASQADLEACKQR